MTRLCVRLAVVLAAACILLPGRAAGQGLTGALIGTVTDAGGGVLPGAVVHVSSPALIGRAALVTVDGQGHFRFPVLPPGAYVLEISHEGFASSREADIRIGAGATIERIVPLKVAGVEASVVVEAPGSRIDARAPGFGTSFGPEDLRAIPSRRSSMFDALRAMPGVSPTSPASGTTTTISAFGSGTNENQFLIEGTNMTCPCNGIARSEPGVDFIQEIQVQSVGASAEFGNVQGAVINVITRQGSNRFLYDASYYAQTAGLTSQPVRLPYDSGRRQSGYERARYRDFTSNLGGPAVRDRLWFFGGYQYLRDYDSQPGTEPEHPRTQEQDKMFAKLTWRLTPAWGLVQSFHDEVWVSPEQPKFDRPFSTTTRQHASVPAMTFGHLTHTGSANTVWEVRVGRFVYLQQMPPSTGDRTTPSRLDLPANALSGGVPVFGALTLFRTTAKATVNHYRPRLWGADHAWKMGGQFERGEHHSPSVIPTGARYIFRNGQPSQAIFSDPSNTGGVFLTAAAFATDAITIGNRLTINAGLRFDHTRAISQDLPAVDLDGRETDQIVRGLGTMYVWNIVSPRLGMTMKLGASGRTILRASYGRFSQGVLTGELGGFHPGAASVTVKDFVAAEGGYTKISSLIDRNSLRLDPNLRAPRTDEYSIGVDREVGRGLQVAIAYVRKAGANFIGWTDVGGRYQEGTRLLADGRTIPVFELVNLPADQRFLLTNPDNYSLTYNGLIMAAEKRRSHGWQAFGSYTLSRAYGLQAGSGGPASGAQVSTVSPPPIPGGLTFGRDPNDLTNARGRLPNDRPHMFRVMGAVDIPGTGFVFAGNLQHFSGKPWAATAQVPVPQNRTQRVQLEPRGTRRLSSQTLLDLRVSRTIALNRIGRVELLADVLNALNDRAEEGLASDTQVTDTVARTATFGVANVFVDPRRAMLSLRLSFGR
jgi:TonB-dependent receptor-like protein/carboxypeptidase family protein